MINQIKKGCQFFIIKDFSKRDSREVDRLIDVEEYKGVEELMRLQCTGGTYGSYDGWVRW